MAHREKSREANSKIWIIWRRLCGASGASHFALHHASAVGMMFDVRFEHLDRAIESVKLGFGH